MESQYLKTFCAVIDEQSFSRAAQRLNITQSAVSQRIKFLETHYGVPLLERNGTMLVPSDAGTVVMDKARQILMLENELAERLKNLHKKNRLALCCTPTFGIVYLPKVLNHFFMINTTDVDFKFILNSPALAQQGVQESVFDLAIIEHCDELDFHNVTVIDLPPDDLVFISSPEMNLGGQVVSLEDMFQHCLIARREGCSSRCLLANNLSRHGKSMDNFKGTIIYDDLYLTIQTVLAGRGVAFVSRNLVVDYLRKGDLLEHSVNGFSCSRARSAIMLNKRIDDSYVGSFIDCVQKVFAQPL